MASIYDRDLDRNPANFAPLTPLGFLARSAAVYPGNTAVIDGERSFTYAEFKARCGRLAGALAGRGIGPGDTVAVLAGNIPAMLEAHFGVPMTGAVLNAMNFRLDAATIAFCLGHGEAKAFIVDHEFAELASDALARVERRPFVILVEDDAIEPTRRHTVRLGDADYEAFLAAGDPAFVWQAPADEWQAIALNYTSGTTGDPKGVVYHHRGAFLNALNVAMTFRLDARSVCLWTLPMFHCNGWSWAWGATAAAATHICLRRVDPAVIYPMIKRHGVTHLCGAPVVLNLLANAPDAVKVKFDRVVEALTGGAAPPSAIIAAMERNGFRVTHGYGLTETYGPATICVWQAEWDGLGLEDRARRMARQGVPSVTFGGLKVVDPATMRELPADGQSIGEVVLRGNTVMKGYLKNSKATAAAFRDGWFHTGDLATRHPDGYVEVKDRLKDIIISGGENISSLEVEEVLYRHPKVLEAAVVARPDEKWGETPCAFVTLKPGAECAGEELIAWCRQSMAHFKAPKTVVFGALPKTSTGKIQKFILREQAKALGGEGSRQT